MNIHLVERLRKVRPVSKGSLTYESGDWTINPEKARKLVGGMIYLHEGQLEPSYFGGRITGFSVIPGGAPGAGKIVLTFDRMDAAIGVRTGKGGWGNEQKTDSE